MSTATRTDTQSPALHVADRHDLIRVYGARESSLVFGTIAAESQLASPEPRGRRTHVGRRIRRHVLVVRPR